MSQRTLVFSAIGLELLVVGASCAMFGWNSIGAHVAARWTARLSVLIFIVAFAQPGLARRMASLPSYATLMHTFLAAHCVHFAAVVGVLFLDHSNHFKTNPGASAAIIGIGFSVVIVSGVTAGLRESTAGRIVNEVTTLFVFTLFMLVFTAHHLVRLRVIAILLVVALMLRISAAVKKPNRLTATASG